MKIDPIKNLRQQQFLRKLGHIKSKELLIKLVNEYASDEINYCFYGNVSDTLPIKYWKFLNLENFISNLMNNDLVSGGYDARCEIERHKFDKKLIKEYGKNNKTNLSFREVMEIVSPYTQLPDYDEIMIRASNIITLCEALNVKVFATYKDPKDWGIKYTEIDEFADTNYPEIVRKTTIRNFAKLFKNWKWKNNVSGREKFCL